VSFDREPAFKRSAVLSGNLSDTDRQKALALVQSISGIASVRWQGDDVSQPVPGKNGSGPSIGSTTASEKIADCQGGVDDTIAGKTVQFRSGSAFLSPQSNRLLDDIATALKSCAGLSVEIGGHTDANGNASVNQVLSQERADRVKAALIERGIDAKLLSATGYGATRPLSKASGREADAQNRRIAFKVAAAPASKISAGTGE
jgi:OOP family OmpA-OmpF porin